MRNSKRGFSPISANVSRNVNSLGEVKRIIRDNDQFIKRTKNGCLLRAKGHHLLEQKGSPKRYAKGSDIRKRAEEARKAL